MDSRTVQPKASEIALRTSGSPPPGLTGGDHVLQAQAARIDALLAAPIDEIQSIRWSATYSCGTEALNGGDHTLGIPCSDWNDATPHFVETVVNRASYEGTRR